MNYVYGDKCTGNFGIFNSDIKMIPHKNQCTAFIIQQCDLHITIFRKLQGTKCHVVVGCLLNHCLLLVDCNEIFT